MLYFMLRSKPWWCLGGQYVFGSSTRVQSKSLTFVLISVAQNLLYFVLFCIIVASAKNQILTSHM